MLRFDANASSRLRPAAGEAMIECLRTHAESGANPSSVHGAGRALRGAIRRARENLRQALGLSGEARPKIVFSSGGTEACNSLVSGFLGQFAAPPSGASIVCSSIEHQAMLEAVARYAAGGYAVRYVKPAADGCVLAEDVVAACGGETQLVSLMAANNVSGAVQDVCGTAEQLRRSGYQGAIVCDATQAFGKLALNAGALFAAGVDALAVSGHKIGGPSGIGAMVFSADQTRCRLFSPLLVGGPQEERMRAGTENAAGIIGFGAAAEALVLSGEEERSKMFRSRELLWKLLSSSLEGLTRLTAEAGRSLPNTLALRVDAVRGDDLVAALDLAGVAASTGSACSSGRQEASHVFLEMGLSPHAAREALRLSLDWDVNEAQVRQGAERFAAVVRRMRRLGLGQQAAAIT